MGTGEESRLPRRRAPHVLKQADHQKHPENPKTHHHYITPPTTIIPPGHHTNNYKGSIYMIFDYMDHDMTGLLARSQREGPPFSLGQIKCYMRQLLLGLSLLQANHVLHRDLKNSNLLINNRGILKIGDFGLARYRPHALDDGQGGSARMTNRVITLWYRYGRLVGWDGGVLGAVNRRHASF